MQVSLWPKGLIGRVTAVLLGALVLEFLGSAILYQQADRYTVEEDNARRVAEQLVVAERLLSEVPPSQRAKVATRMSTKHLEVEWQALPVGDASPTQRTLREVKAQILEWEPTLADRDLRLQTTQRLGRSSNDLIGSLQLTDGSWLHFRSPTLIGPWSLLYTTALSISLLALCVLLAAALVVHTLGAPLRSLAQAADAIGRGNAVTVAERGSRDLRLVARAFNAMQVRIDRLIASRTEALAAVSHDLRTPLARLKLRTGLLGSEEDRAAIESDIAEMDAMFESLLAYLGGETDPEKARLTDLAALLITLVDDATDAGRAATYDGPDHLLVVIRPLAMKRAFGNLIENAIKYGSRAGVTLRSDGRHAVVVIDDDGPGIPESEMDTITAPFRRLDTARARDTSGFGLGLAIVANAVARETGAKLALRNRSGGGLSAEIRLPLPAAQSPQPQEHPTT
ncbi:MAG: HAMP domain-containing protein [Burkholderiales bacterium]|nr:HAMP domain-containing protein [Burkholderiales bacterium]